VKSSELENILTEVGLSENQAKVYLASLRLGVERATEIARAAEIKRTTVYPVIEQLESLGLMTLQMRGFKKLYAAEPPEQLAALVEQRQQKLKDSLVTLNSLQATKEHKHAITYHESLAAIRQVYNGLLADVRDGEDYMIFSSAQELFDLDPEFFEDFFLRRAKRRIKIRCLFRDSPLGRKYQKDPKKYNVHTKIFPSHVTFTANLVIIPKKVVIHQLLPPNWAIVIENEHIVKTHQQLFESFWASIPD